MFLTLLACALVDSLLDGAPARIDHAEPGTLAGRDPFELRGQVVSDKGKPLAGPVSYSVVPADVAAVSASGSLSCLKSGDASIVIAGAGLSATTTARCRIVGSLRGPAQPIELLAGVLPAPNSRLIPASSASITIVAGEQRAWSPLSLVTARLGAIGCARGPP